MKGGRANDGDAEIGKHVFNRGLCGDVRKHAPSHQTGDENEKSRFNKTDGRSHANKPAPADRQGKRVVSGPVKAFRVSKSNRWSFDSGTGEGHRSGYPCKCKDI